MDTYYDRLSALDAAFLQLPDVHKLLEDVEAEFCELHKAAQTSAPSADAEIALSP